MTYDIEPIQNTVNPSKPGVWQNFEKPEGGGFHNPLLSSI